MAVMYSTPDDSIGPCGVHLLTLASGDFSATYTRGPEPHLENVVHIAFEGGPDSWSFRFQAPNRSPLVPGHYPNATGYPFQDESVPGLDVSGQGRGCGRQTGEFTIQEAEFADDGTVLRFAADFGQSCGTRPPDDPKLHGTVRFRSSLPRPTLEPPYTPTPTQIPPSCPGDCDRDGEATVDELVNVVNLALGNRRVAACASADRSKDFRITVEEIAAALQNVLVGCIGGEVEVGS
jgi:hypothetical protein